MIYTHNHIAMASQMFPKIEHLGAVTGKAMRKNHQWEAASF